MEQNQRVDEFLAHVGVKGMHWGSRKGAKPTSTKTQVGQVATGGLYLGKKSRYTTPQAQKLRKSAGNYRTTALSLAGASMLSTSAAMLSNHPSVRLGAQFLSLGLSGAAELASVGATVQGVRAVNANK